MQSFSRPIPLDYWVYLGRGKIFAFVPGLTKHVQTELALHMAHPPDRQGWFDS